MPRLPYVLNPKGHFRVTTDALSALVCEKMELLPGNQPKMGTSGTMSRFAAEMPFCGFSGKQAGSSPVGQLAWQCRASERRQVLRAREPIKTATRVKESWRGLPRRYSWLPLPPVASYLKMRQSRTCTKSRMYTRNGNQKTRKIAN